VFGMLWIGLDNLSYFVFSKHWTRHNRLENWTNSSLREKNRGMIDSIGYSKKPGLARDKTQVNNSLIFLIFFGQKEIALILFFNLSQLELTLLIYDSGFAPDRPLSRVLKL